ncbi:MAG: glycosyltransferase [Nitrospiraceae bacterium]
MTTTKTSTTRTQRDEAVYAEMEALVAAASALFRSTPMPLQSCLELRRRVAARLRIDDPLSTIQQRLAQQQPKALRHPGLAAILPERELGEWALSVEAVNVLLDEVQRHRPEQILEFGCGSSTVALTWAMQQRAGASRRALVASVDQSEVFRAKTVSRLEALGLATSVNILHAPLREHELDGLSCVGYGIEPSCVGEWLGGGKPDFVLIDGPAADHGGRFATVPSVMTYLQPGARIYLDDALRDSELAIADWWSRLGYVAVEGILWVGKGLLVGRIGERRISNRSRAFLLDMIQPHDTEDATALRMPVARVRTSAPEPPDPGSEVGPVARPSAAVSQRTGGTCVFVNTYYPGFLKTHYQRNSHLAAASYETQHAALIAAGFGDSDFYSEGLRHAGWATSDLIVNCEPLQQAWVRESGRDTSLAGLAVAVEQIRRASPDVVYLHDLGLASTEFLTRIRPFARLIVGQIASPVPPQADVRGLDIIVSSFPHFVDMFRAQGITAYYQPLAFEPRLLPRLVDGERTHGVTFVGGLSPAHRERQEFIRALAQRVPLECWGYGTQSLVQAGVDASRLHGECWGLEMFNVLRRSRLTINHHIDAAKSSANNMRLFEATGCGALLITDYKDNLHRLFDVGSEVVAYRSLDECVELVTHYLAHPDEAAAIARRGQARTLGEHAYGRRMAHTATMLGRHLRANPTADCAPVDRSQVSSAKRAVDPADIPVELAAAWESPEIPARQRALVDDELRQMWAGHAPVIFQVLAQALRPFVRPGIGVLEIGCASGYYAQVLEYLLSTSLTYTGVDVSAAMVALARECDPGLDVRVGNGAKLEFTDGAFPIAVSSCVLLHVRDYADHIREAARVSSDVVVLHRTPICRSAPTQYFRKLAYGVETQELRFNEAELFRIAHEAGLRLHEVLEYEQNQARDEFEATYVFRKSPDGF